MGNTKSINCKECNNKYWEMSTYTNKATCSNCGFEREYKRRGTGTQITKSQQKAADKIKAYFDGSLFTGREPKELHKFELEMSETGRLFVRVETSENIFATEGGSFIVGRRGGIKMTFSSYIGSSREAKEKYEVGVAKLLGAKR